MRKSTQSDEICGLKPGRRNAQKLVAVLISSDLSTDHDLSSDFGIVRGIATFSRKRVTLMNWRRLRSSFSANWFTAFTLVVSSACMGIGGCKRPEDTVGKSELHSEREEMKGAVECTIKLQKEADGYWIGLRVRNVGVDVLSIPYWTLVEDGKLTWAAFEVSRVSNRVPYRCMTVKRAPPATSDLHNIIVGETYSVRVLISKCYNFSAPGEYLIQYVAAVFDTKSSDLMFLKSNVLELSVLRDE